MIFLWLAACASPAGEDTAGAEVVTCDACDGDCVRTTTPNLTRHHVEGDVVYADEPPSSGDHNPCWASWGAHTEQVAAENWVHNLEHGAVVFLYACPGGCEADLAALTGYVETLPTGRWVLSPYAAAPAAYTVVAWEEKLELGCLDLDAIGAFYDAHVGHGPEDTLADPSAECM